jgi:hypothetical protein
MCCVYILLQLYKAVDFLFIFKEPHDLYRFVLSLINYKGIKIEKKELRYFLSLEGSKVLVPSTNLARFPHQFKH